MKAFHLMVLIPTLCVVGCGIGGGSDDEDCKKECGGRECGPDPKCGKSCGECDDGNDCTEDSCRAGQCEFTAVDDQGIGCDGVEMLRICSSGQEDAIACGDVCLPESNATSGCEDGATIGCRCWSFTTSVQCTPDASTCTSDGRLAWCMGAAAMETSANYWQLYDCDPLCEDAGYTQSTGCGYSQNQGKDVCLCCTKSCQGKECGDDGCGGSCGSCSYPLVCSNNSCVQDPCSSCLDACRGLPSCCTGEGCMCDDEC